MNFKKFSHIVLFVLTLSVYSQKKVSKGDGLFFSYAFQDAIVAYEEDISKGFKLSPKQYLNLADSYFKVENYEKATNIYLKLFAEDSIMGGHHLNKLLQGLGKRPDLSQVQNFLEREGVSFHKELLENGDFNTKLLASKAIEETKEVQIFNVASNSQSADFSPSFFEDFLLFTSGRPERNRKSYEPTGEAYLDIFKGEITENGQISGTEQFKEIAASDYHKATPYYSSDLNAIVYVLSNTFEGELEFDEKGKNALAIGIQRLDGEFNFLWRDLSTSFFYPF